MMTLSHRSVRALTVLHMKEGTFYAGKFKADGTCIETKRFASIQDAVQYLNTQKSIGLVLPSESKLEIDVTLSSLVTSDAMIRQLIRQRLDEEHAEIASDVFTFTHLSTDTETKESVYRVFLINDSRFYEITKSLKKLYAVSFVTFEEYAFANFVQRAVEGNVLAVYTDENKVIVLALAEGEITFQRVIPIREERDRALSEVEKTILYIQQYQREREYSHLILAGGVAEREEAAQRVFMLSGLPVSAVLMPASAGFSEEEERYEPIFLFGVQGLTKEKNFLPPKILRAGELYAGLGIVALGAALFFLYASFNLALSALDFRSSVEAYETIQNRLQRTVRQAKTYPLPKLLHSRDYIGTYMEVMKHHPVDDYFALHRLIALLPPKKSSWKRNGTAGAYATFLFEKDFKNLSDLYLFEKSFERIAERLKKENEKLRFISTTDYKMGRFSMRVDLGEKERKSVSGVGRRRRHR
ncbi:hypothetical protein [Hydrogenimonas cancrithermarum]|nr:hypothetical protein [Hydrogenimonas cancrithermarum]